MLSILLILSYPFVGCYNNNSKNNLSERKMSNEERQKMMGNEKLPSIFSQYSFYWNMDELTKNLQVDRNKARKSDVEYYHINKGIINWNKICDIAIDFRYQGNQTEINKINRISMDVMDLSDECKNFKNLYFNEGKKNIISPCKENDTNKTNVIVNKIVSILDKDLGAHQNKKISLKSVQDESYVKDPNEKYYIWETDKYMVTLMQTKFNEDGLYWETIVYCEEK